MTVDPQGRLVAGGRDNAGIFRITPPALDGKPEDTKVEKLEFDLTSPNGLLYAFDSLYVMKCGGGGGGKGGGENRPNGLYRITASKPGGEYDTVTLLRSLNGGGDHGPHYVQLSPDGKSLTVVCGNSTKVTEFAEFLSAQNLGRGSLHPLLASFGGVVAPSGWIARVDPEGKKWDLYSAGFRNQYGAVYNHNGDLFTYDSDMEWDIGLPWYRPSRVSMAASGGDAGFRNGSRNMPPRYPDSLPAHCRYRPRLSCRRRLRLRRQVPRQVSGGLIHQRLELWPNVRRPSQAARAALTRPRSSHFSAVRECRLPIWSSIPRTARCIFASAAIPSPLFIA